MLVKSDRFSSVTMASSSWPVYPTERSAQTSAPMDVPTRDRRRTVHDAHSSEYAATYASPRIPPPENTKYSTIMFVLFYGLTKFSGCSEPQGRRWTAHFKRSRRPPPSARGQGCPWRTAPPSAPPGRSFREGRHPPAPRAFGLFGRPPPSQGRWRRTRRRPVGDLIPPRLTCGHGESSTVERWWRARRVFDGGALAAGKNQ